MTGKISVQESVRLAKEAMGAVPAEEHAAWIAVNHGLTVKPVIVKVMLGLLQEKEHLEQSRLKALEVARTMEPATKASDCAAPARPFQSGTRPAAARKSPRGRGCPECSGGDYVFRGRKKTAASGQNPPAVETKHPCRDCGNQWKEKVAVEGRRNAKANRFRVSDWRPGGEESRNVATE